jgi:ubiquinone/menaquinone biosynthesis C-methylase UbiE
MTTVSYRSFTGTAAENYERHFVPKIATPVSVALLETAALRPGERVLDVGCGTGVIARLAAEAVGSSGTVTGLDLTPDMIQIARAVSPSTIDWHVGDATSLPFADEAYDAVLCQMCLMFMQDRHTAVAEMRRVTPPAGASSSTPRAPSHRCSRSWSRRSSITSVPTSAVSSTRCSPCTTPRTSHHCCATPASSR